MIKRLIFLLTLPFVVTGCFNSRKLVTDEIVFKDGNSQTGTILQCDSTSIRLKKMDESVITIAWENIDTIQGKKLKTLWIGSNYGYYKAPYFSVFRNEAMTAKSIGMQHKIGMAYRGNKLYYLGLTIIPSKPYTVTKFGFGYQQYLGATTYIGKQSFFVGGEFNLMNAKYNNGSQVTLEPFSGYEYRCTPQLRLSFKLQLQFNLANKNSQTGISTTIGIHFLRRNFKRYYQSLNHEHRLPRK